jgi:hypothetical protein
VFTSNRERHTGVVDGDTGHDTLAIVPQFKRLQYRFRRHGVHLRASRPRAQQKRAVYQVKSPVFHDFAVLRRKDVDRGRGCAGTIFPF